MIGDRVGSEGVDKMMSQKEELVGLMIRVIAETGIKPLCYMIREQVIQHQNVAKDYMFRGQWVKVDPSTWRDRTHTTVRVGTGSGNRKQQQQTLGSIMTLQKEMLSMPGQSLITDEQTFNAINDFAKAAGMPSARRYFMDPKSDKGMQHKKMVEEKMAAAKQEQDQKDQVLLKAQADVANAEVQKAEAQQANVQLKAQAEQLKGEIATNKGKADAEIAMLEQRLTKIKILLDEKGRAGELEFRYWEAGERFRIEELRIMTAAQTADHKRDHE
jgi:hypothetical protein